MRYPEPSYAVSIWYAEGELRVQLDGHFLRIPLQAEWPHGLLALLRRRAARGTPARIAEPESLTNWQMEQLLKKSVTRVGVKRRQVDMNIFNEE